MFLLALLDVVDVDFVVVVVDDVVVVVAVAVAVAACHSSVLAVR